MDKTNRKTRSKKWSIAFFLGKLILIAHSLTSSSSHALRQNFNEHCKSISVCTFVFNSLQTFLYQFCFVTSLRSFFRRVLHTLWRNIHVIPLFSLCFFRSVLQFGGTILFFPLIRRQHNPFAERRCHDKEKYNCIQVCSWISSIYYIIRWKKQYWADNDDKA